MPNKIIIDEITTLRLLHDTRKNMQKYCQGQKNAPIKKALIEGYALFGDEKVACQKVKDILLAQISEVNFNPYAFKSTTKEEDKGNKKYLRREFSYSKFQQALILPDDVEKDKINANVTDGVLTIELPKRTPEEKAKINRVIEIH